MIPAEEENWDNGLLFRNALADIAQVDSVMTFKGEDLRPPLVTIAIPTFRRMDLLQEAVRSALNQSFESPFEIIVLDNEPGSKGAEELYRCVPEVKGANLRYFVNRENAGMYGNHNLCIRQARGEWVTILHDDDLLDPDYLSTMFAELARHPGADGIVPRKRIFDQRAGGLEVPSGSELQVERMSPKLFLKSLISSSAARRNVLERLQSRIVFEYMFLGRPSRRVRPRVLFTGPALGNPVGFLFNKNCVVQIGGFYPEDFPGSDMYLFARFAQRFHLRQHRAEEVSVRIASNETARMPTVMLALPILYRLQRMLAGREVPRWWLRFAPLALTRLRGEYLESWGIAIPLAEIETKLGLRLPADRPKLLQAIRIILRAH
jgi:glycosyltransferase involved in cell wall biosynthesis